MGIVKYIIDKSDLTELLKGEVLATPKGNIRGFCVEIAGNLTNGDMIKAMFPDCKDWKAKIEDNDGEVYKVHFVQFPNSMTVNKYEEKWWSTPYKAESEDKK